MVGAGTAGIDNWARGDVIAIGDPWFGFEADGAKDGSAEASGGTLYSASQGYLNTANTASSDTVGDVRITAYTMSARTSRWATPSTIDLLTGDFCSPWRTTRRPSRAATW